MRLELVSILLPENFFCTCNKSLKTNIFQLILALSPQNYVFLRQKRYKKTNFIVSINNNIITLKFLLYLEENKA